MERTTPVLDEDRLDQLEQLFILRKFDECLPLSEALLEQISEKSPVGNQGIWNLHHRCSDAAECDCIRLVTVFIQVLYELGRSDEVINFVVSFYGDEHLPFAIVWLCANLLLSTGRGDEAQNLIGYYLVSKRGQVSSTTSETLRADYNRLLDFLLMRILAPRGDYQLALRTLDEQRLVISQRTFEEFTRRIHDAERDHQLRAEAERASARFKQAGAGAGLTDSALLSTAATTAAPVVSTSSTFPSVTPKVTTDSPTTSALASPTTSTASSNYWSLLYAFSAVSTLYLLYRVFRSPRLRQFYNSLRQSMRELVHTTFSSHYGAASALPNRR